MQFLIDKHTFYSTFKKYYGVSPRSYQQHNTNRKY